MKKLYPVTLLVIGLVLIFLGIEAKDSVGSVVSEVVNDAPSNKSILLLVGGAVAAVVGLGGLFKK